jgi:hypothetical protein
MKRLHRTYKITIRIQLSSSYNLLLPSRCLNYTKKKWCQKGISPQNVVPSIPSRSTHFLTYLRVTVNLSPCRQQPSCIFQSNYVTISLCSRQNFSLGINKSISVFEKSRLITFIRSLHILQNKN